MCKVFSCKYMYCITNYNFIKYCIIRIRIKKNFTIETYYPECSQGFGREKDANRSKFIGSNLVIFFYKEFEKFALCRSISQSEVIFVVYYESIESGHVKTIFPNGNTFKMKTQREQSKKLANLTDVS